MPITDKFQRLPLSAIKVFRDERQRREIKTESLEKSIRQIGLLSPIIVRFEEGAINFSSTSGDVYHDNKVVLVAGERRLEACRRLGLPDIPVRFAEDLTSVESAIIELEENIKRSDLPPADLIAAVAKVHELHISLDPAWTQAETGEVLSLEQPTISMYLRVWNGREHPRVQEALKSGTIREAYNVLVRRDSRAEADKLAELLEDPPLAEPELAKIETEYGLGSFPVMPVIGPVVPVTRSIPDVSETILHESFLDWAPSYSGPKFNLIHCDFPYGIDHSIGPQGRGSEPEKLYSDSKSIFADLFDCLLTNIDKLMSVSGHIMFWCPADISILRDIRLAIHTKAPSIAVHKFPLIWFKSDNAGIAADPRHGPRHVYETCLFMSRGNRQIVRVVADTYSCQTRSQDHPSCKPESMLRHFMTMLVDEHTSMLDPTCGSGSSLRAAESLGAKSVLGLESELSWCEQARMLLKSSRVLRQSEKLVR